MFWLFVGWVFAPVWAAPDYLFDLHNNDLTHANYYLNRGRCPYQLIAENYGLPSYGVLVPNYPLTTPLEPKDIPLIEQLADKTNTETLSSTAQALLHAMQADIQFDRLGIFLDAWEEHGNERHEALKILLSGDIRNRLWKAEPSLRLQTLFYLIKLNRIPSFLLNRGLSRFQQGDYELSEREGLQALPRHETGYTLPGRRLFRVFFDQNGAFRGASVTMAELLTYHQQLLDCPTLTHLTVQVNPYELSELVQVPVLKRLKSLGLEISDNLPVAGPVRLRQPGENAVVNQIEWLQVINATGVQISTRQLQPLLHGAELQNLFLDNVRLERLYGEEGNIMRALKVLSIMGGFIEPSYIGYDRSTPLFDVLDSWFQSMNPDLEFLTLKLDSSYINLDALQSRWALGTILGNLLSRKQQSKSPFRSLRTVNFSWLDITSEQWQILSGLKSFWQSVESFFLEQSVMLQPESRVSYLNGIANCLRLQPKLTQLLLNLSSGHEETVSLLSSVITPLRQLTVQSHSGFSPTSFSSLLGLPALAEVEELDLPVSANDIRLWQRIAMLSSLKRVRFYPTNQEGRTLFQGAKLEIIEALKNRGMLLWWDERPL